MNNRMEDKDYMKLWDLLGEIPQAEPSEKLVEKFNLALREIENKKVEKGNFYRTLMQKISGSLPIPAIPKIAFAVFLLAAGAFIGYFLHPSGSGRIAYHSEIDSLSARVSELKQIMVLSLLQ